MHHAYLVVAERDSGIAHARERYKLADDAHPDVHVLSFVTFGIDDARMLKTWAYQRPIASPKRIFIVSCDEITHETQNALLKLFEEPPATSLFSLVVPHEDRILPTLRSRFEVEVLGVSASGDAAAAFLGLSYAQRLEEVAKRTKGKDLLWQQSVLSGLEQHFRDSADYDSLQAIALVEQMIGARGSSPKMLLEHLALALPPR